FHYASGIVKEQVIEKIRLVSNNYKDSVNNLIANIDEQLERIVTDDIVYYYFDFLLLLYPGGDAGEEEMENYFFLMDTRANVQYTTAHQLDRLIKSLDYSRFAYAALADGLAALDSRVQSFADSDLAGRYIQKKLAEGQYREIEFGQIYDIEGEPYLLYSKPVKEMDS